MLDTGTILVRVIRVILTDDVQMDEVAHVWRRADLALVDAGVAVLRVLDLKGPVFTVRVMDRAESLVTCVRIPAHRKQVDVAMSHPGHLQQHLLLRQPVRPIFHGK
jgi:hypothetical protein